MASRFSIGVRLGVSCFAVAMMVAAMTIDRVGKYGDTRDATMLDRVLFVGFAIVLMLFVNLAGRRRTRKK